MRIGSLFSGYGGLDLAVESATGATPAWFVEFDQAPGRVLAHHWPDVPNYGDITAVDWAAVEPVDILTGGFPCQDLSHAGKRLGLRPGTRSGLWEHMAYAIDRLRPRLVVIENVRGLLSAEAHSDMERDCWCVGDDREPALRALGAVLGDLAELGYDARWGGVRAADAGAPHSRFRVFIIAHPNGQHDDRAGIVGAGWRRQSTDSREPAADADIPGLEGRPADGRGADQRTAGPGGVGAGVTLLPTPVGTDSIGARNATATRPEGSKHHAGTTLTDVIWKEFNGRPTEAGPDQALSDLRGADDPQAVRETARGHDEVPEPEDLRPGLWSDEVGSDSGGAPLEGAAAPGQRVPGVLDDGTAARPSHRQGPDEQRPGQPDDAVRVVPPSAALAGGPPAADGSRAPGTGDISATWGPYAPAILRWEMVTGRVAPPPTEPGKDGRPRLSPLAVEWLMGLPAGHVTAPAIGLTRAQQLKALGNGVVPQQAALALRLLLGLDGVGVANHGTLLPTPNPFHAGNEEDPDEWRKRRADVFKRTGTRHGPALGVVAKSLLPGETPLTPDTYMPDEED